MVGAGVQMTRVGRIDPCPFQWPRVTLKGGTPRVIFFFCRISTITLEQFDLEWPNMAWWSGWCRSMFLSGQPYPILRGWGSSLPNFFCDQTVWSRATKFGMVTTRGLGTCLQGSTLPHPRDRAQASPNFGAHLPAPIRFDLERPNLVCG